MVLKFFEPSMSSWSQCLTSPSLPTSYIHTHTPIDTHTVLQGRRKSTAACHTGHFSWLICHTEPSVSSQTEAWSGAVFPDISQQRRLPPGLWKITSSFLFAFRSINLSHLPSNYEVPKASVGICFPIYGNEERGVRVRGGKENQREHGNCFESN